MRRFRAPPAAGITLLVLASLGCGADDEPAATPTSGSPTASPTRAGAAPTSESPAPRGTRMTTAPSDFGEILWGPKRQVVYIWEKEPTRTPECYGDCADAWPPVLTTGEPRAARDVDQSKLGTTTRRDGSTQVTYNGHPLYYYAHEGPGEVLCHDITTHGGTWWVVTPAGDRAD
ncbi:MAG TPA: hypothetical protein VFJ28_13740 [Marmoricola sp.]|nr:hypothetical protein [Marmoricola sp.]